MIRPFLQVSNIHRVSFQCFQPTASWAFGNAPGASLCLTYEAHAFDRVIMCMCAPVLRSYAYFNVYAVY